MTSEQRALRVVLGLVAVLRQPDRQRARELWWAVSPGETTEPLHWYVQHDQDRVLEVRGGWVEVLPVTFRAERDRLAVYVCARDPDGAPTVDEVWSWRT